MGDATATIADGNGYELRKLGPEHHEDYSLRHGGLYVEFSDVQWLDKVWTLHPDGGGTYMSVRHSAGIHDVPEEVDDALRQIA